METLLALVVGTLYAGGFYMMLQRSLVKLAIGLALLSHGANLLIFTVGRLVRAEAPIVPDGATQPVPPFADPLPQALVLTAIVISFGVLAFLIVLLQRAYEVNGTEDSDQMKATDQ
jgi:multicomponent Na+:H+ antiporter subunit C